LTFKHKKRPVECRSFLLPLMACKPVGAMATYILAASPPSQMVQLGKHQKPALGIGVIMLAIGDRLLMLHLISFGGTHEGISNWEKQALTGKIKNRTPSSVAKCRFRMTNLQHPQG
jgi:hypothetical protein